MSQEILACPEPDCESPRVSYLTHRYQDYDGDYRCRDCGWIGDDPIERQRKQNCDPNNEHYGSKHLEKLIQYRDANA